MCVCAHLLGLGLAADGVPSDAAVQLKDRLALRGGWGMCVGCTQVGHGDHRRPGLLGARPQRGVPAQRGQVRRHVAHTQSR
jgi:hypothetical protein